MVDEEELTIEKQKDFMAMVSIENYLQLIEPIFVSLITRANGRKRF